MVEWVDATNVAEWVPLDEVSDWASCGGWVCRNVGYLVHEDDECVVLAARIALAAEPVQVGLFERIPKAIISGRWTLTAPGHAAVA
jgi:hypothetical protein